MNSTLSRPFRLGNTPIPLYAMILFLVEISRGAALISFLPLYGTKTLGLSLDVIGAAITAHYVTDTVLKMGIGYLLDRFSIRFTVHTGILISLAGVALFPFAHIPWMFIVAAALYGVGISPIWIVCLTQVSEEHRAAQMGFLYMIWLAGIGAGPIVCNIIMDHSRRAAYLLILLSVLLAWILSLFISGEQRTEVERIPLRTQLPVLKQRLKQMRLLLPGMVLQTAGAGMLVTVLPTLATSKLGLSGAQYSLLLTAGGVFTFAGLVPFGRLSDRWRKYRRLFLIIGFFAVAASLYALSLASSFWACMIIAALLGFSYAAVLPAWNALLASYVPPKQQGLGWGMLSTVEGLGGMIGPVAGGVIASWRGEPFVVWISALLFGLMGVCYCMVPMAEVAAES